MKTTVVIMAGGKGERFWPKSRKKLPKQFLCLSNDGKTMIQHTVSRVEKLVDSEDIFVVTSESYKNLVMEQLPNIPEKNILIEPISKNTAPCIGLAAIHIRVRYGDAVMIVLPSDHVIKYNEMFLDTLKDAVVLAEENENMVTIGITPSYPETGYGYICLGKANEALQRIRAYEVEAFTEKPTIEKAKEYVASGKFLWNSGMFVWKASTILSNISKELPKLYEGLIRIKEALGTDDEARVLKEEFMAFTSVSIDYGIMEKCKNIYTLPGNFGWDDVGSWLALERINTTNDSGNVISGNIITIDSKNSIIQGSEKLIATIGIENLVIVETKDAILISRKDQVQDIKKVVDNLKICNRDQYL